MKVQKLFLIFITLCLVTGCSVFESAYAETIGEKIITSFDNKDAEKLSDLFCDEIKSKATLSQEIESAFLAYKGSSVSYNITDKGCVEESLREGRTVMKRYVPHIDNIVTDDGNEYYIGFSAFEICEYNSDKVGISILVLYDKNGNQLAIIGGSD